MSVAYYHVCQDVVYKGARWYGVTNRVLTDPFMAKTFVTLSNTNTQIHCLRPGFEARPWEEATGPASFRRPLGSSGLSIRIAGANSSLNMFRFTLDCKEELCESGATAFWPGMLHSADSEGAPQFVLFAGPLSTNVHCCPICEVKEAPSLLPSQSGRALLWTREPLEGKQTGCTARLRAPPQTLPISFDTCCPDPRSDVSASYQPQVPMTPLV